MQKQNGFTLIELVVVIIILGILAVTAAPKFINLQSDARASTLQGLKGSMQGANSLVYSKSAIAGEEREADTTVQIGAVAADSVKIAYGYLQNDSASILEALDISTDDWTIVAGDDLTEPTVIYQSGSPYDKDANPAVDCHFEYTPAQSASVAPKYEVEDTGC
ncbi:type II secretion system GspH family protein [Shewanella abyssi]|uniref:type II secretion system protein n=1 Tax=Shewanella abyssi TaxID=311789 RepID=UPI00200EF072|nr:type II secretion system protein [Shewanella abyssi]MCL1050068.1 type II secretion system GspH family protein [Shewanella abyssi]